MRLLLVSGDSTIAEGHQSKFKSLLDVFQQGWERIDIIVPPTSTKTPITNFGNVYIHPAPHGSGKFAQYAFVGKTLTSLVQAYQHDLVSATVYGMCTNALAASRAIARLPRRPRFMIEVLHVAGVPRAGGLRDHIERRLVTTYLRGPARKADAIRIMNANETPTYLTSCGLSPAKFKLIPAVFYEPEEYVQQGEQSKQYDLMFCGRLMPNKGLDLLLATFEAVRRKRPTTTMLIKASGGVQRDWLEREIARLDAQKQITIIDWVETPADLVQLYSRSRILLCTSYNEGGPRVTVEAMVCGTPVISTRVGIMPDIIEHGVNGYLADWDANDFARYCLELLDNEQRATQIGNAGAATVSPLTRDAVIDTYVAAYQTVARQL